jgi:glycosyltransferase involved in cell wall biosynthesis
VLAYPGIHPRLSADGPKADLGAPYVFTAATLEPRKNLDALLEAFAVLRQRRPELLLAIAGPAGWGGRQPSGEGVRLLGYVGDEELARLYRGAEAFAFPSLFEGFGIPVVEAMASGVPVVASSHVSLDEASGGVALRADPGDPEAFADAIERAIDERDALVPAGLEHAKRFTWRACGEAMLRGYENARG